MKTIRSSHWQALLLAVVMSLCLGRDARSGTIKAVGAGQQQNDKFVFSNNNALEAFPDSGVASADLGFKSSNDITFEYTITKEDLEEIRQGLLEEGVTLTHGTISFDAILLNFSDLPWSSVRIALEGGATWGEINLIRPDDPDDNRPGNPPNGNSGPLGGENGDLLPTPFSVLSNMTEAVILFDNPITNTGNSNTTGFEIGIPNPFINNEDWRINLNSLSVGDSFLVTFSPNEVLTEEVPEPASLAIMVGTTALLLRRGTRPREDHDPAMT